MGRYHGGETGVYQTPTQPGLYQAVTQPGLYQTPTQSPLNPGIPASTPESQMQTAYQGVMHGLNGIAGNQMQLSAQVANIDYSVNKALQMCRKPHRKVWGMQVARTEDGQIKLLYTYNDGNERSVLLIQNVTGRIEIIKICFARSNYTFYAIVFPDSGISIIGVFSKLNPKTLFEAFIRCGVQFNPQIPTSAIVKPLFYSFAHQIENCRKIIKNSGLAGWEDGKFYDATDYGYLERFKPKLKLPVLEKFLNRVDFIPAHADNYMKLMRQIQELETRVLFSIIPLAAIMKSLFHKRKMDVPVAVNLILMTDDIEIKDIAEYLQIFNREESRVLSLDASTKDILRSMEDAKDEVLLFAGLTSLAQTNYRNNKVSKNLNMVAQIGMGNGISYGGNEFMASVLCIANQRICIKGVKNVYVDAETIVKDKATGKEKEILSRSVDAVIAGFVTYIEEHMEEVEWLMKKDYKAESKEEQYWQAILSIVDDFWRSKNHSLCGILGIPEDFTFDFLWQDDADNMNDSVEMLVSAFRRRMPDIAATPKSSKNGFHAECIYDDESIWIYPELLDDVLVHSGIKAYKNAILLECRERGMLQANQYGGYTTRLQIGGVRKEYYRFQRSCFNRVGLVEIISLGRKEKC